MVLMNRGGQVFFFTIMIAIVFIICALAFAPPIKQFADDARNSSTDTQVGLDCGNSSISTFDKGNCTAVDLMNPYFIGFMVFFAGAIATAKITGAI